VPANCVPAAAVIHKALVLLFITGFKIFLGCFVVVDYEIL